MTDDMTTQLQARIGRFNGWWCVRYRMGGRWDSNHYGSLVSVLRAWARVKRGREPQDYLRPDYERIRAR